MHDEGSAIVQTKPRIYLALSSYFDDLLRLLRVNVEIKYKINY